VDKIKPLIRLPKDCEWKLFKGTVLPMNAIRLMKQYQILKYGGSWIIGAAWYKGESPEKATHWSFVTDDAVFYKVRALYGLWHPNPSGEMVLRCSWSLKHLKLNCKTFLTTGEVVRDPDYQT